MVSGFTPDLSGVFLLGGNMRFLKDGFKGVVNGDVYPTEFKKGDECPEELERAAVELGFVKSGQKGGEELPL